MWARTRERRRTSAAVRVRRFVASVLGAVSDDQDVQASCDPAGLCPIGMAPRGPERVTAEAAVLLEAADDRPPIVAHPLQEGVRGRPGINEPRLWAAAQMMAGLAEPLQGQLVCGRAPWPPESQAQRHPPGAIRPDEQDQRDALHGPALLAGEDPRQALHRGRTGLRNDRVIEDQGPPLPDEQPAPGALQACVPRPVGWPPPCPTVMRHGWPRLTHGHAGGRGAIIA